MRRLARLCVHDSLHEHYVATSKKPQPICPGGEFLPEDALVIEKDRDGWVIPNEAFSAALDAGQRAGAVTLNGLESALFAYFDALLAADQVGEPG